MQPYAIIKTDFSSVPDRFQSQARSVSAGIGGHALVFPTPVITMAAFDAKIAEYDAARQAAINKDRVAIAHRNTVGFELKMMMIQLAGYVTSVAAGNRDVILDSGFQVRNARTAPVVPVQVTNVKVILGLNEGTASLKWKAVKNADSYLVQTSTNNTTWNDAITSSKSRTDLDNLPTGGIYFRVAAFGAAGWGAWSLPVFARVA